MCLSEMSSCELLLLANNISLGLSNNLDAEETALLAAFLTTVADQLAIIAIKKATLPNIHDATHRYRLR